MPVVIPGTARASASIFERHSRLTLAALLAFSIVATDQAFTRAYLWAPRRTREGSLRVKSPIYHHGFRPLASVDGERWGRFASPYRINSLGFRDRAVRQVPLEASRPRIVFIGDSFTEGVGLPYEKTFVGLIAEALAPRQVEVLNAAVASFSPVMYYRRVRHLVEEVGLKFDNLVVFIDIGDIEDETTYKLDANGNVLSRPERRVRELGADKRYGGRGFVRFPRLKRALDRNSLLLSSLYGGLEALFPREGNRAGLWTVDQRFFEAYGREGLEKARENMDRLLDLLRRNRIRLAIAVYPWPDQILHGDLHSKQVSFWRRWAAERGVGFIDYFPRFVDRARAREVLDRYFIPGDIHWNEAGHRLMAEGFLEYYEAQALDRRAVSR